MLNDVIIVVDITDKKPERMGRKKEEIINVFYQLHKLGNKKPKHI
jgi:hypothetical protein